MNENFIQNLKEYVGAVSFARGQDYYRARRVIDCCPENNHIEGEVQGNATRPYQVEYQINSDGAVESFCTCPVGYACKHVAALALDAYFNFPQAFKLQKSAPVSKWVGVLSDIPDVQQENKNDLSLQIIVCSDTNYDYNSRHVQKSVWALKLRPQTYDARSRRFSIANVSWSNASPGYRQVGSATLSSSSRMFLNQLWMALHTGQTHSSYNDRWFFVNAANANAVWHVLRRHAEYNVALVPCEKSNDGIAIQEEPLTIKMFVEDQKKGLIFWGKACLKDSSAQDKILIAGKPSVFGAILHSPYASVTAEASSPFYFRITSLHPAKNVPFEGVLNSIENPVFVPDKDVDEFSRQWLRKFSTAYPIENRSSKFVVPERGKPKIALKLSSPRLHAIEISLNWYYGEHAFPLFSGEDPSRDLAAERKILTEIENILSPCEYFWNKTSYGSARDMKDAVQLAQTQAIEFLEQILPQLKSHPDVVMLENLGLSFPTLSKVTPQAELYLEESPEEADWFDLKICTTLEGESVPLEAILSSLIKNEKYLFLPSGRYASLDSPFFQKLKSLIRQAGHVRDQQKGVIALSRFQAGWWDELQKIGIVKQQAERWKKLMEGLLKKEAPTPVPAPSTLKATLRFYQADGFSWLCFLHENQLGGILADDMGLGKTVQTLALYAEIVRKKIVGVVQNPLLIVAPTSVVENWDMEFEKFVPTLHRIVMRKGDRSEHHRNISTADVVLTSYALLGRDEEHFQKISWEAVVIDEAQFVKNHLSKAYSVIRRLKAHSKFALTGTPFENNLMELWSIASIVCPGLFPDKKKFREAYQIPIEKNKDLASLTSLRVYLKPFLLRRTKEKVEQDLPAKIEQTILLPMDPKQRHLYDVYLQRERLRVLGLLKEGGMKNHRFEILTSLLRLRQICLHPSLVDSKYSKEPSAKLDAICEHVEEILSEDHKIIAFSQFTSFLTHIRKHLDKVKTPYLYLDGSTKDRKTVVNAFQKTSGEKIFLISLKAGGFGLNLIQADYCLILDPWWNPAVEMQAIDRAHRIGQSRPVIVYRFIMQDTIEEKVAKLQEKKRALFQNVLGGEDSAFETLLTEEDIRGVFDIPNQSS